jgi:putative tricarboxylic transport membrane protein
MGRLAQQETNCPTNNLQGSWSGLVQGIRDTLRCWVDSQRGGIIGSFIGLLPGLGGAMADWLAYGSTVAAHPQEQFGRGNIRGVIGAEGANNAQKASSFIPTVLFGIPGAPFAAILMGLFMYLGIDLGSPDTFTDQRLFDAMSYGFLLGTAVTAIICYAWPIGQAGSPECLTFIIFLLLWLSYYGPLYNILTVGKTLLY